MAAQDQELRAALFRFVDVTPACTSLDDLARHLSAYLDEVDERPPPLAAAMRMSQSKAGRTALGAAAAAGVRHMAHRFIVGETPSAAVRPIRHLWEHGAAVSLDLLGEATVTQPEADRYAERCLDALETLAAAAPSWPERPLLERDSLGRVPRVNVSVKVSALSSAAAARGARDRARRRGSPDAPAAAARQGAGRAPAHRHGVGRHAGGHHAAGLRPARRSPSCATAPPPGSCSRRTCANPPTSSSRCSAWAGSVEREPPLVVRLVKGAYWDHEVVEARQHGWTPPVYEQKAESDRNFEQLTRRLLEGWPHVRPAIASHNLRSVAHAVAANRAAGRADGDLELQVLRGLGDDLAAALADLDMRVRIYCPVGDMVAGMAYLVRRLLENTANESFLSDLQRGVSVDELLAAP